ncbi:MAG: hypothetical protein IIY21_20885 [Clostridiales bacterium]|nr:hypothetical protein [Clostridiales bacterium]
MYDAVNIDTGEIVHTFDPDDGFVWFAEGKKRAKRLLKDMGYEYVKDSYEYHGLCLYVREKDVTMKITRD